MFRVPASSRRLLQTHRILWCELFEEGNEEPDYDPAIESMVLHTLPANRFVDPASIVLELNLIVWDADKALPRLVARGTRVEILILKGHVSAACPLREA